MRTRRLARALPAALLVGALLASCGDDTAEDPGAADAADVAEDTDGSAGDESVPALRSRSLAGDPLDDTEAAAALLAQANMPLGFDPLGPSVSEPPSEDQATGCESEVSFEDRFDRSGLAATRTDNAFLYVDQARLLIVTTLVASFADEEQAESAFEVARTDYESCTRYEETGEGGETTVVEVEHDDETSSDEVDDQINMLGDGLWTLPDAAPVEMGFGLSVARIGNSATLTQIISIGVSTDSELLAPYTEIAVDRLAAVAGGETPDDVTGPAPTAPPATRLPPTFTTDPSTGYEEYLDLDPRFSLPD